MVMIDGKNTLVLVSTKGNGDCCYRCYFNENTCPNNGVCIKGDGYWKKEEELTSNDITIDYEG